MADAGRPCKFQDIDEYKNAINNFFDECDVKGEPYTITGLALALDTSREVLMDIESQTSAGYTKEFSNATKRAKLRCHNYAEKQAYLARNPAASIFIMKNYGWRDQQDINLNMDGIEITVGLPKTGE
jgi:hypothetical protein